ncbi:protein-glutamate O-methyltransferase [Virgisporangium aliadipatigenens]|uniref:Protein-glutamate O-methyltransferase n=1 Tax=Virgisporangium aliadipatigenens TaxID=741659 RepID=A0A8J3YJ50_9ACTN|nr:protein-glutamate O-methyltransferase CheR [Virgisporangium aliadipatigenens]GIJ45123.1 protein-glutamate O-methyltransferase [Virgisporangium aliadipatigenens]
MNRTERFREVLTRRIGLALTDVPPEKLAEILDRRMSATGLSADAYLAGLVRERAAGSEVGALARELTINETYFFRNPEQFDALREVVLPERLARRAGERRLRLLSAACSSGEEAYTMATVVRERVPRGGWDVQIVGVDLDPSMVERARRARYAEWSMRATPPSARSRWFHGSGDRITPDADLTGLVRFAVGNLADDEPELLRPGTYDVIFCRNAIMYFTGPQIRAATARLVEALAPGGFLFLGHAEVAHGRVAELTLRHSHDTFYYQREPAVQELPPPAPPAPPAAAPPVVRRPPDTWERVLALLRAERFDGALHLVESMGDGTDELLVTHAALLIQHGRLDRAEALCRRLLERDGMHAGAHYLLALCREGDGDKHGAAEHDRRAAYLDPGFALPRLRLGLLARRDGDRDLARRELEDALRLLSCEDDRRLLLFGGGFSRAALIALCRAELRACG